MNKDTNYFELFYQYKLLLISLYFWIIGIAIAINIGWLSAIFAIVFPPYSFILVAKWFIDIINKLVGL